VTTRSTCAVLTAGDDGASAGDGRAALRGRGGFGGAGWVRWSAASHCLLHSTHSRAQIDAHTPAHTTHPRVRSATLQHLLSGLSGQCPIAAGNGSPRVAIPPAFLPPPPPHPQQPVRRGHCCCVAVCLAPSCRLRASVPPSVRQTQRARSQQQQQQRQQQRQSHQQPQPQQQAASVNRQHPCDC
jgi:hypothetical protein